MKNNQKNSPVQLRRKLVNLRYRMKLAGYEFNDREHVCIVPGNNSRRSHKRECILRDIFHYGIQYRLLN